MRKEETMDRRLFLWSFPAFLYALTQKDDSVKTAPALFVSHGSPMNIIEHNAFTKDLKKLGKTLEKPRAILVVSAHWIGRQAQVSAVEHPETIYDFYGFPDALYDVEYPVDGGVTFANETAALLGVQTTERGLDHGSWSVLHHLFPGRDVPVFQLSIDMTKPLVWHYQLGQQLAALRKKGIMLIGSGNATHNLHDREMAVEAPVAKWTKEFHDVFKEGVLHDHAVLIEAENKLPHFAHAHPTIEHYLPVLPVLGSMKPGESIRFFHEGYQHGTLDMSSFIIQ